MREWRVEGFQMDEGEDGTDVVRAACGSFVMPRTRAALLHSEGWGGVDEWETMIERALEWLTISMRALPTSLLTGTGVVNDGCTTSRSPIDLRSDTKESPMDWLT